MVGSHIPVRLHCIFYCTLHLLVLNYKLNHWSQNFSIEIRIWDIMSDMTWPVHAAYTSIGISRLHVCGDCSLFPLRINEMMVLLSIFGYVMISALEGSLQCIISMQ